MVGWDEIEEVLDRIPTSLPHDDYRDAIAIRLGDLGFKTEREVWVRKGARRRGRIDLKASLDGVDYFFEIDRCTPKEKSVLKLKGVMSPTSRSVVVLRFDKLDEPRRDYDPRFYGVDHIFHAHAKPPWSHTPDRR